MEAEEADLAESLLSLLSVGGREVGGETGFSGMTEAASSGVSRPDSRPGREGRDFVCTRGVCSAESTSDSDSCVEGPGRVDGAAFGVA